MEKELDPDIIKTTQLSLGKYVKRPPLSEKLLKKPPFRFLHDIVTSVLKTTGFFENLFEEDELISDNVKDRENKILFLNKVIFVLSSTTGKPITAKPSKIVAGQEPEKTNELLQCLAKALDEKLSSDASVKLYKESSKASQPENRNKEPIKSVKKANDSKKLTSRSREKLISQRSDISRSITKQDKEKANDVKSRKKENGSLKVDSQNLKKSQQSKTINTKNGKDNDKKDLPKEDKAPTRNKNKSNVTAKETGHNIDNISQNPESDTSIEGKELIENELNDKQVDIASIELDGEDKLNNTKPEDNLKSSSTAGDLNEVINHNIDQVNSLKDNINNETIFNEDTDYQNQSNSELSDNIKLENSDLGVHIQDKQTIHDHASNNKPESKMINADKEPASNIKVSVPPKMESKVPRPSSVRPSSSRPGAPRMREKLDNVMKDTDNLLLGKVNIITENTQNEEEEEEASILVIEQQRGLTPAPQDQQDLQLSSNEHGHLVQQILDSQKEMSQITGKTEIEWQFGAQKAREAMNQEIEQLRFNIQALSRITNPLGKLLDHIQEDVEVMRQELHQWSNISEDVNKEMLKQKTLNEDSLTPFHTKLKQLDRDIEEKHDKINDLKILIHKNAFRIEKLLTSGSVQ